MSPGITKFLQTSVYDPFLVVLFTKLLSLLKSLHNIPGSGLLSLYIVSTSWVYLSLLLCSIIFKSKHKIMFTAYLNYNHTKLVQEYKSE